ncbi:MULTISPECIES: hypothetical protein [Streptosporangium]|uniref:DUF4178 domain-containing protein n=1 Tax=Streptosporangium brasiliense TaxID=47480 RepID=A0ABT9QYI4_9ACTN|nr:hypothetical protein [Streptosporangium brasiliense]MDP9861741.1 hypothetical protein [Streptosporangium brasiliense]
MTRPPEQPGLPPLIRALIGPPGRLLLPATALAGSLLMYGVSVPGDYFLTVMLAGFLCLVLAIVWIPRFVVALLRADGRPGLRRHWLRWAAAPVMGAAVTGLLYFDVPATARFALSEASLERFARAVAAGEELEVGGRWVGLYTLDWAERTDGVVRFLVAGTGFIDRYGFAWSPGGEPPDDYGGAYHHLRGPWYEWREDF